MAPLPGGPSNDTHPAVCTYHRLLVWDIEKAPKVTRYADKVLNPLMGKSWWSTCRSPRAGTATPSGHRPCRPPRDESERVRRGGRVEREAWHESIPEVSGVISAAQVVDTARSIVALQRPDGMIEWFPGDTATRGTTWRRPWP